jgi:hypothetical protein
MRQTVRRPRRERSLKVLGIGCSRKVVVYQDEISMVLQSKPLIVFSHSRQIQDRYVTIGGNSGRSHLTVVLDKTTRRMHPMQKTQQPSIGLGRGHTPS